MKFTEDALKLYDEHPLVIANVALHHEDSFLQGTGYSQFLRNYSCVILMSYFEDYMEKETLDYQGLETTTDSGEWELLNEFRNTRNCIIHNNCRVDEKYIRNVVGTTLKLGEALMPSLDYLRTNAENLGRIARKIKESKS